MGLYLPELQREGLQSPEAASRLVLFIPLLKSSLCGCRGPVNSSLLERGCQLEPSRRAGSPAWIDMALEPAPARHLSQSVAASGTTLLPVVLNGRW